jgi:hypothetical protein
VTSGAPKLVIGPLTRYADVTSATVWVETSGPAEVEVLGRRALTFEVEGHHYGLVVLTHLAPGTDVPYDVRLDGDVVWPPQDGRPAPLLRTVGPGGPLDLVVGSCRVSRPHEEPWTLLPDEHPLGVGVDALHELSVACQRGDRPLPELLLLVGDQVYADEGLAPHVREWQVARRGEDSEPRHQVADFEEYTWLYYDSWSQPEVRWLLSTVPSAMIFDDHDVHDDWNTSRAWRRRMADLPWWPERLTGAYLSYWIYQHLGNLAPSVLETDPLASQVLRTASPGAVLKDFAAHAGDEEEGRKRSCWSYARELGGVRLVVVDSRSGRMLDRGERAMLSPLEWAEVEQHLRGDCDHLLVVTSLPLLLEPALHDLERWDEALTAGVWGRRAARVGEWLRQGLDLEHWAAFGGSFERMVNRLKEVASGERGRAPATVLVLSGDVHHSYVSRVRWPDGDQGRAPVAQLVSSPLRNAYPRRMRQAFRLAHTAPMRGLGRLLTRLARLPRPPVEWSFTIGPVYGNVLVSLRLDSTSARARIERSERDTRVARLSCVYEEHFGPGVPREGGARLGLSPPPSV